MDQSEAMDSETMSAETSASMDELVSTGMAFAIYLQEMEWQQLLGGSRDLLKSYRSKEKSLMLVVRKGGDHLVVGAIELGNVEKHERLPARVLSKVKDTYSNQSLQHFRKLSATYHWVVSQLSVFDKPAALVKSTKFKNRTFNITASMVMNPVDMKRPSSQCLKATAQYFFGMLAPDDQLQPKFIFKHLDNRCIRVGTTCSGSDICIKVLQDTVSFLNSMEAWFAENKTMYIHNHKKIYIQYFFASWRLT